MKGNLLFLKDLLEPSRTEVICIWLQYKKNLYTDKLDNIANKYNNAYHRIIKMKPIDVIPSTYFVSSKEINYQDPEFKIGDVKISTYKNVFEKGYLPNRSKEVFVIKKVKNTVPRI